MKKASMFAQGAVEGISHPEDNTKLGCERHSSIKAQVELYTLSGVPKDRKG